MEATDALAFPVIEATTHPEGHGVIVVQGTETQIDSTNHEETRSRIVELAAEHAATLGRPVKMTTHGTEGTFHVIVDPTGTVKEDENAPKQQQPRRAAPEPAPEAIIPAPTIRAVEPIAEERTEAAADAWVRDGNAPAPRSRREARHSFLVTETVEKPASRGLRGMATRAGIRMSPGEAERQERLDERAVSQHWPGQRTIAIVNGKGGAGKTPSTICLSAVFARYGGAGVLAWDNNQTRGTLGWRTEPGAHDARSSNCSPRQTASSGPAHSPRISHTSCTTRPATSSTCCDQSPWHSPRNSASSPMTSIPSTP